MSEPLKLRPGEIRFWQEAFIAFVNSPREWRVGSRDGSGAPADNADVAIAALRERMPPAEESSDGSYRALLDAEKLYLKTQPQSKCGCANGCKSTECTNL